MLIDFHTHTFPDKVAPIAIPKLESKANIKANTDGTVAGLLESMRVDKVDISVVLPVATSPSQVESINRKAYVCNDSFDGRGIYSFGAMHPDYDEYKRELNWLKENGFKGIKLHGDYQGHYVDDDRTVAIMSECERLGLFYTLHAGIDIGFPEDVKTPPSRILKAIEQVGGCDHMILAHMGGWKMWDEVIELLGEKNMYLDMAFSKDFMTEEQFVTLVKQHGSDHILFATDSPWDRPGTTLEWLEKKIKPMGILMDNDFDNICWRNASRILGV